MAVVRNPEERLVQIAKELRDTKAEIILLKELLEDARKAKADSEDIRHAVTMATIEQARDMEKMCEQMIEWKAVVKAAQDFCETGEYRELHQAVEELSRPV